MKLVAKMKNPSPKAYIKDFDKFQLAFKEMNEQFSLCSLFERIYEITVLNKSFIFLSRYFNGWGIKGLEHYIGLCVGNRKNNFSINFVKINFDTWRNITYYGVPDKIDATYLINTKRKNSEYLIADAKLLMLYRFLINYNDKLYNGSINRNFRVKDVIIINMMEN
jgi:hypothetical protein